jgi:hypothetical protein
LVVVFTAAAFTGALGAGCFTATAFLVGVDAAFDDVTGAAAFFDAGVDVVFFGAAAGGAAAFLALDDGRVAAAGCLAAVACLAFLALLAVAMIG